MDQDTTLTEAGYTEHSNSQAGRLALAEFVGTFTLIFIGAGSIITSGGNLVAIAFAHGLAIATMVSAVGHVSGGHFNPAVTFAAWITKRIDSKDALLYWLSQLAGAVAGALLLRAVVDEGLWKAAKLGTPILGSVTSAGQGVMIEAILTFFLVWVIFATAIDGEGSFGKIAGLAIGFVIVMDIFMGGPLTGAAMNPARFFGPALVAGEWADTWVYWVGPLVGGALAALLYDRVIIAGRAPAR